MCRGSRGVVLVEVRCGRLELWVGRIWARLRLELESRDEPVKAARSASNPVRTFIFFRS